MKLNLICKSTIARLCLSSIFLLSGCAVSDLKEAVGSGNAISTSKTQLKPTNPGNIKAYDARPKNCQVVGRISADNYNVVGMEHSQETIMTELKKQASSIGANGIININSGLAQTTAEAVVVRK